MAAEGHDAPSCAARGPYARRPYETFSGSLENGLVGRGAQRAAPSRRPRRPPAASSTASPRRSRRGSNPRPRGAASAVGRAVGCVRGGVTKKRTRGSVCDRDVVRPFFASARRGGACPVVEARDRAATRLEPRLVMAVRAGGAWDADLSPRPEPCMEPTQPSGFVVGRGSRKVLCPSLGGLLAPTKEADRSADGDRG